MAALLLEADMSGMDPGLSFDVQIEDCQKPAASPPPAEAARGKGRGRGRGRGQSPGTGISRRACQLWQRLPQATE
eukprot:12311763-Alexandrium_andersonii.AAC.1